MARKKQCSTNNCCSQIAGKLEKFRNIYFGECNPEQGSVRCQAVNSLPSSKKWRILRTFRHGEGEVCSVCCSQGRDAAPSAVCAWGLSGILESVFAEKRLPTMKNKAHRFPEACPEQQALRHDFRWFYPGCSKNPEGRDEGVTVQTWGK